MLKRVAKMNMLLTFAVVIIASVNASKAFSSEKISLSLYFVGDQGGIIADGNRTAQLPKGEIRVKMKSSTEFDFEGDVSAFLVNEEGVMVPKDQGAIVCPEENVFRLYATESSQTRKSEAVCKIFSEKLEKGSYTVRYQINVVDYPGGWEYEVGQIAAGDSRIQFEVK